MQTILLIEGVKFHIPYWVRNIKNKGELYIVNIESDSTEPLDALRKDFERILKGENIRLDNVFLQQQA